MLKWILAAVALGLIALWVYVRTAPLPADQLATRATMLGPGVYPTMGGHRVEMARPTDVALARLLDAIKATPRTRPLHSAEHGVSKFLSRSPFWGFPDITQVIVTDDTLVVDTHLVFGRSDFGVNKARIEAWLAAMGQD